MVDVAILILALYGILLPNVDGAAQRRQYFKSTAMMTYGSAITFCGNNGGQLATITDEQEMSDAVNICLGSDCWIGLNDIDTLGAYKWADATDIDHYGFNTDGTPIDCKQNGSPWGIDKTLGCHPNVADNRCTFIDSITHKWEDETCKPKVSMYALCHYDFIGLDAKINAIEIPLLWHRKYFRSPGYLTYDQAIAYCAANDGVLATISNAEQLADAAQICPYRCWIGLNSRMNVDEYVWVDGSPIDYGFDGNGDVVSCHDDGSPWGEIAGCQPNEGSHRCVYLWAADREWEDFDCDDNVNLRALCHYDVIRSVNARIDTVGNVGNDWYSVNSVRDILTIISFTGMIFLFCYILRTTKKQKYNKYNKYVVHYNDNEEDEDETETENEEKPINLL